MALSVLFALVLLLLLAGRASGDEDLTALIGDAFLPRAESAELHDIAHQRAVEISRDFSHDGMRPGTAEVLALNAGFPDPVGHAVEQWLTSPDHFAILSDSSLDLIGCAAYFDGETHYFACVLARSAPVAQPAPRAPSLQVVPSSVPVLVLPNTAMGREPTYGLLISANYLL